ncbi:hypothetical protein F5890DRAFT_1484863 [Lentinula detonsa]|uniref:CFEM domain-containing protein n=1 Tax=Lentinula detonsa TaxID=2804962 RepID=A0AA38UYF5_9AGAR|nr:hypothetical protein F5890DRAFT_1484863 [Lentinula detonsa]
MFCSAHRPWTIIHILACAFAFAAVRVAEAQASDLPSCADGCIQTSLSALGCTLDDTNCLCTNSTFVSTVLQCSALNCTANEQATLNTDLNELCDIATSSSGFPGTSTGISSGTITASTSAATTSDATSSDVGVITLTTTLPGGSSVTVTATLTLSNTPSPPISFTSSVPIIGPSTISTSASESASFSTSTNAGSSVVSTISSAVPPLSSTSATPVTTLTSTEGNGNGVSTAPAGATSSTSSSSNSATRTSLRADGISGLILTFLGTMAVFIDM